MPSNNNTLAQDILYISVDPQHVEHGARHRAWEFYMGFRDMTDHNISVILRRVPREHAKHLLNISGREGGL